ncbi:hypothetical protein [Streptomyces sp. NPDC003720]|uniref:hypothetical protein n=1 Tax=Streptomyces sp. NPDC003720 TaxID=3364684 RepID=UPI00367522C5
MMSDTSVALISSASALAAGLITGGITWLAGRSQLAMQLRDQRQTRAYEYRRDVYTACIELLTAHVAWSFQLAALQAKGISEGVREANDTVRDSYKAMMHRTGEIRLVGPPLVASAYDAAEIEARRVSTRLDQIVAQNMDRGEAYPDEIDIDVAAFHRALDAFAEAARKALRLDY